MCSHHGNRYLIDHLLYARGDKFTAARVWAPIANESSGRLTHSWHCLSPTCLALDSHSLLLPGDGWTDDLRWPRRMPSSTLLRPTTTWARKGGSRRC